MDLESRDRRVEYSQAKDAMFAHTNIPEAPWFTVEADDKKRDRLNCISHFLSKIQASRIFQISRNTINLSLGT